jgi:hypothetical protein
MSQFAPPAVSTVGITLWGEAGFTSMPARPADDSLADVVAAAVEELVASVGGEPHPVDVHFGLAVVELIVRAGDQIAAARGA